jgi:2-C-methyl-D-erythritol 4-phosphate cytidylyltransferase
MTHLDTSATPRIWAIVPAAGSGRRMGQAQAKQYLSLSDKTLIEHTLTRLLAIDAISEIVVALSETDTNFEALPLAKHPKIQTTLGGRERSDSVLAALNSLQQKARSSDWVLVHDAARCCIRVAAINRLLDELSDDEVGGILGVPASDTLKSVSPHSRIQATVDRGSIWQAQTPQLFRYGLLRDALQQALGQNLAVTDEASAVELAGYQPKMVRGDYDNIKITHPEDRVIAAAILQQQEQESL